MGAARSAGRGEPAEVPLADALGLVGGHDFADQVKYAWKVKIKLNVMFVNVSLLNASVWFPKSLLKWN